MQAPHPGSKPPFPQSKRRVRILVVPGNPGYSGFYSYFQKALQDSVGEQALVSLASHVGHGIDGPSCSVSSSLTMQQVDSQVIREGITMHAPRSGSFDGWNREPSDWLGEEDPAAFLERAENDDHPHSLTSQCLWWSRLAREHASTGETLVLVGHSIGAYIAIDAASRLQGDVRVVGVMPFLRRDASSLHQRGIQRMTTATARVAIGAVATMLSTLPRSWRTSFIRIITSPRLSPEFSQVVADWTKGNTIRAALRTAAHEFHDLAPQRVASWRGWDWLSRQSERPNAAFFFGAEGDVWAPTSDAVHLGTRFPHVEVKMFSKTGLRHDFCVDKAQSLVVAEDVASWIRKTCGIRP